MCSSCTRIKWKRKSFHARARIHFSAACGAAALALHRQYTARARRKRASICKNSTPQSLCGMEMRFLWWRRTAKTCSKCIKKEGNGSEILFYANLLKSQQINFCAYILPKSKIILQFTYFAFDYTFFIDTAFPLASVPNVHQLFPS